MIDDERHHHTCDCDACLNRGGGVPATATPVTATPDGARPRWRSAVPGTARAEQDRYNAMANIRDCAARRARGIAAR